MTAADNQNIKVHHAAAHSAVAGFGRGVGKIISPLPLAGGERLFADAERPEQRIEHILDMGAAEQLIERKPGHAQ